MSDDPFFPPIPEGVVMPVKVIMQHMKTNPNYLDHVTCPYPPKLKEFLKSVCGSGGGGGSGEVGGGETTFLGQGADKFEVMIVELDKLYTDLKAFRSTLGSMDPNEKSTFFKTTMALLEKIANLKERIYNMKEMADFQKTVVTVMEQHLDTEKHKQIIEELNGYLR